MANRFTNFQPQEYVSTRIPLPLELIMRAGAMKQHNYDTNRSELQSGLDATVKSIEEHDPYRNSYVQGFNQQAQALINDPNTDFGNPETKQKINNLIYQHANNPNLQILNRSIENKKKQLDDIEAIKKTKDSYAYWNDPTLHDEQLKQHGINPYMDEKGTPLEYQFRPMQTREDHVKPATDLFDKIKDSEQIKAYAKASGDERYIESGKTGWEGVSLATIKAASQAIIEPFKTTAGGQDFLRKFNFDHFQDLAQLNPEQKQQVENQAVEQHLNEIGSVYVHKKTTEDKNLQATALLAKKHEEDLGNLTTSTQSEALPGSLIEIPSEIKDLEFDSKGNPKPLTTGALTHYTDKEAQDIYKSFGTTIGGTGKAAELAAAKINAGKPITNQFDMQGNKKIVDLVNTIQKSNPELQGTTPKQTIEAYKASVKALESESIPLRSISNVAGENIGEAISRNKTQRNFYIYDGKEKTTDGQLSTVLDKLDIKEEDFDKALKKGIAGYTQAGPNAGSYYVEVKDNDGNSRRVMISPDEEMKKIFSTSQAINEARKQLTPQTVSPLKEAPNYKISITPNIKRDGSTTWTYTELITDNNGNVISSNPTTLDAIRESERNHLVQSNYLGAQTGVTKPHTTE